MSIVDKPSVLLADLHYLSWSNRNIYILQVNSDTCIFTNKSQICSIVLCGSSAGREPDAIERPRFFLLSFFIPVVSLYGKVFDSGELRSPQCIYDVVQCEERWGFLSVCVCVCLIVHMQVHRCTLLFRFLFFFCPSPRPSPALVGTIAHVFCVSACILYE